MGGLPFEAKNIIFICYLMFVYLLLLRGQAHVF